MGYRIMHSATMLRHRPCSKVQTESELTPIQEQFHTQCEIEKPKHSYGELVYAHIEKKDRPNKTGPRAFQAIYAGQDRRVKNNIIVHPFVPNNERTEWNILKSVSVNQFTVYSGYFALHYTPLLDEKKPKPPEDSLEAAEGLMTYEQVME